MLSLNNYEITIFQKIQLFIEKYYVPEGRACENEHAFLRNRERTTDSFDDRIFVHYHIDWSNLGSSKPKNKFCEFLRSYFNNDFEKLSRYCQKASLSNENTNKIWEMNFRPSKEGTCKIVIAAEMDFESTMQLFQSMGISFYNDDKFDIVMMFCFENGIFDLCTINKILYLLSLPMLCYGVL